MRKPAVRPGTLVEFDAVGAGAYGNRHEAVDVHDVDLLAIYGSRPAESFRDGEEGVFVGAAGDG